MSAAVITVLKKIRESEIKLEYSGAVISSPPLPLPTPHFIPKYSLFTPTNTPSPLGKWKDRPRPIATGVGCGNLLEKISWQSLQGIYPFMCSLSILSFVRESPPPSYPDQSIHKSKRRGDVDILPGKVVVQNLRSVLQGVLRTTLWNVYASMFLIDSRTFFHVLDWFKNILPCSWLIQEHSYWLTSSCRQCEE